MRLPDGVTINIAWHGDDRAPIIRVDELRELLADVDPNTPIYVKTTGHGDLDCIQIGGEPCNG